jgi:excisionase family DNA binding protein
VGVGETRTAADTPRMSSPPAEHASPHPAAEALLTASHLAKRFAVSQAWVYQAVADGRLPHRRLGSADGPVRFVPSEIDAWLDEQRLAWAPARRR